MLRRPRRSPPSPKMGRTSSTHGRAALEIGVRIHSRRWRRASNTRGASRAVSVLADEVFVMERRNRTGPRLCDDLHLVRVERTQQQEVRPAQVGSDGHAQFDIMQTSTGRRNGRNAHGHPQKGRGGKPHPSIRPGRGERI